MGQQVYHLHPAAMLQHLDVPLVEYLDMDHHHDAATATDET